MMQAASPTPTAMICVASEQTWPNLLGLLHFKNELLKNEGLELAALRVYHTDNIRASQGPAQRFQNWCERQFPSLSVRLSGEDNSCSIHLDQVAAKMQAWMDEEPEWDWIINATGGLKMMTLGLSDFIGPEKREAAVEAAVEKKAGRGEVEKGRFKEGCAARRVRVVYFELSGAFELCRDASGRIVTRPLETSPTLADWKHRQPWPTIWTLRPWPNCSRAIAGCLARPNLCRF